MSIDPVEFGELRADVKNIVKLLEKQNGRLGAVEKRQAGLQKWQYLVTGGVGSITGLVGFFSKSLWDKFL